jgi:hypothetical protein
VLRGCEAEREEEDVDHRETQVRLLRNGQIVKELEDFVVCKFCQGSPSTFETRIFFNKFFSQVGTPKKSLQGACWCRHSRR